MPFRLSLRYTFPAPPERVWPIVADTERMNRALGLPQTAYEGLDDHREVCRRRVRARQMGLPLVFDEEPFEWVENRYHHVARAFRGGPFRSFRGGVTLSPVRTTNDERGSDGCEAHVWAEIEPASRLAPLAFRILRAKVKREWDRFAARIRRQLEGASAIVYGTGVDAAPAHLREQVRARLAAAPAGLTRDPLAPRLFDLLARAGDVDLEKIRPFRLAREWQVDGYAALGLCLRAARAGVLDLSWDILCPNCRGSDLRVARLEEIRGRAHCDSCHIVYDADFDRYVEVTFRPNPRYREVSERTYCIAGPRNTPHILAQLVLHPGEERDLELELSTGVYRLRTLTGGASARLDVLPGGSRQWAGGSEQEAVGSGQEAVGSSTFTLHPSTEPAGSGRIHPSSLILHPSSGDSPVRLRLASALTEPAQVVLESFAWDEECATAAVVSIYQEFRDLFGSEVLAPDVQLSVRSLPLLFTDLKGSTALYERLGDAPAYALVRDHFRFLEEAVAARGGGVIKTIGDSIMAAFPTSAAALACALDIQRRLRSPEPECQNTRSYVPSHTSRVTHDSSVSSLITHHSSLKIGLHAGPCIAVRANDRLDYFGSTVNMAARLHQESQGGDVVISEAIRSDPEAAPLLEGCEILPFETTLRGIEGSQRLWRILPTARPR